MPTRPKQPCKTPGCHNPSRHKRPTCTECRTRTNRDLRTRRGDRTQQGYGHAHRTRFRIGVLELDRLCVICKRREAVVADHYPTDRKTLVAMKLDPDNPEYGRGLCTRCHDQHTAATQPGGWYRGAQGQG